MRKLLTYAVIAKFNIIIYIDLCVAIKVKLTLRL